MQYEAKNFERLFGTPGFSDDLLKNHFTLYQAYVSNTNKLADVLNALVKEGKQATPEYAELKRRFGWEFNGMRLHEFYFENMTRDGNQINENSKLFNEIIEEFGSFKNWENDFKATSMMRGIGWVVLFHDSGANRLFNAWINEHDVGHLATAKPVLVIDVFEHAFMLDYGLKRVDYVNAFFKAIDWRVAEKRFE